MLWLEICSGSTDQCECCYVDISQCLLRSKHNIDHDVANCPFLNKKYSKCDSLADFLSYLEHVLIEAIELLNRFEESKPEPECSEDSELGEGRDLL